MSAKKQKEEGVKDLESLMEALQSRFGEGAIMTLGERGTMRKVESVSTGSFSLNLALGVGGFPKGRIIEIFGPESSGKTTLALHVVAETQKSGGRAAYIDAEHALDPQYASKIGVKIKELIISQPDNGEEALNILESLVRSNIIDVVVIDSVAALTPRAEIEGEMGDSHMGLQARLMSQALRKLAGIISKSKTTVVFINQIRMKIGVVFGNPETTPGGNALKFYCSVRIEVRRAAQIKKGEKIIGNRVKAKVVKNKVAAPFQTCEFDIMYNEGISRSGDLIDIGTELGIVEKNGNSYTFEGEKLGVGRENARMYLATNTDLMSRIRGQTWEKFKKDRLAA